MLVIKWRRIVKKQVRNYIISSKWYNAAREQRLEDIITVHSAFCGMDGAYARADERGTFIAASARFEPGNSIFLLTVDADGASGTFEVIADAGVHQLALMMPTESLTRACTGTDIQISAGKRRIVTDAPGTATKRGGEWCVASPAVIHYE